MAWSSGWLASRLVSSHSRSVSCSREVAACRLRPGAAQQLADHHRHAQEDDQPHQILGLVHHQGKIRLDEKIIEE